MQIAVIGTGYVGLVAGTCFAESGNDVTCVDVDAAKIDKLREGVIPIFEPGLSELVHRTAREGRLHFTTDLPAAVRPADVVLMAVGTPPSEDGSADMSIMWKAVDQIAPHLAREGIVVVKSTVPIGTNAAMFARLRELSGRECHVVSNPEFLKEGAAIDDFMKPDRVVVGVRRPEHAEVLRELYAPFLRTERPFLVMSPESAETTKYVANSLLATKISFINEMANLCERLGADINDVRRGIGHDTRIGFAFLFPGVGYGGSCFPKDIRALQSIARAHGYEPRILAAVDDVNTRQKSVLVEKILAHFERKLAGRHVALWGLSFKPRTDDIREAPALTTIDRLLAARARLAVHDPVAMDHVRALYGDRIRYCDDLYEAADGAEALAIMTEWKEFAHPNFDELRRRMKSPVIFDGRNLYEPSRMKALGFTYHSIGRAPANP